MVSPIERLRRLVAKEGASVQTVDLEFAALTALDPPVLELLAQTDCRQLHLFGNRLAALPAELARAAPDLEFLDVSSNDLRDPAALLPALAKLTKLRHLHVTLPQDDAEPIRRALPGLETLNGQVLHGGAPAPEEPAIGLLRKTDLEDVAVLYERIVSDEAGAAEAHAADFDNHVNKVVERLNASMAGGEPWQQTPWARQIEVLRARVQLFDICAEKLEAALRPAQPRLADGFAGYRSAVRKVLSSGNTLEAVAPSLALQLERSSGMARRGNSPGSPTSAAEVASPKSWREATALKLNERASMRQVEEELARAKEENARLRVQVEVQQQERRRLQSKLNGAAPGSTAPARGTSAARKPGYAALAEKRSGRTAARRAQTPDGHKSTGPAAPARPTGPRDLSMRQLKDAIEDLLASKLKYDQKCAEAGLPRETVEQHMYTFLWQKYGLKPLVVEWASSIIHGIKARSHEDNDIAVFGKILRNEVDEEFRFVQRQLKETVRELLRVFLQGTHPLKTDAEIAELQRNRLQSFLAEEEYTDIVTYMYDEEDAEAILGSISRRLDSVYTTDPLPPTQARSPSTFGHDGAGLSDGAAASLGGGPERPRGAVRYSTFLHVLLEFQLKGHERFLAEVLRLFRHVDDNGDGVLTAAQCGELIRSLDPTKPDSTVASYVKRLDPHELAHVTFSQVVAFFSTALTAGN